MDAIDKKIMSLLQEDCSISQARIASAVGLTAPSVNERMRKLEESGIIRKYVAILDQEKMGFDITAFIEVFIEEPRYERLFAEKMRKIEEVQECHFVSGEGSCLLKVKTQNRLSLKNLLLDKINSMKGVRETRTIIVLSTVKEETILNLKGSAEEVGPPSGETTKARIRR